MLEYPILVSQFRVDQEIDVSHVFAPQAYLTPLATHTTVSILKIVLFLRLTIERAYIQAAAKTLLFLAVLEVT